MKKKPTVMPKLNFSLWPKRRVSALRPGIVVYHRTQGHAIYTVTGTPKKRPGAYATAPLWEVPVRYTDDSTGVVRFPLDYFVCVEK
jgi:hypothetical protein